MKKQKKKKNIQLVVRVKEGKSRMKKIQLCVRKGENQE